MADGSRGQHVDLSLADRLTAELRVLRDSSGKSLRELEKHTHTSDSSLSRYLSGQALPPWPVVHALATLTGRDPEPLHALWIAARHARNHNPDEGIAGHAAPAPPASGPRAGVRRWHLVVTAVLGVLAGAAIQPATQAIIHATDAVTNGPYFTVDLLATPPDSPRRTIWTDTARCGSADEYRLTYDLPAGAQHRAAAYRVHHADCTIKLFDGLSGTGYGEILTADDHEHDLSPRITGAGVSVVVYSCCNGHLLS
jgi:transcriptional regulator with XRE-family HTH domain